MKTEYTIKLRNIPFKDKLTGKQKKYYWVLYKNQLTNKYKSGGTIFNEGRRVEVWVSPTKQQERTENKLNKKFIERHIDALKQERENGRTWQMVEAGIKKVKKIENKSFYNYVNDKLWGPSNSSGKKMFLSFIKRFCTQLAYSDIKTACSKETAKEFARIIELKREEGYSAEYLKKFWANYVRMTKDAYDYELVDKIPMNIKPSKKAIVPKAKKQYNEATEEELKALDNIDFDKVDNAQFKHPRHNEVKRVYNDIRNAFLFSAIHCGFRGVTLQNLKWKEIEDIEGDQYKIYIYSNWKNDNEHSIYVPKECDEYIGKRRGEEDYVFEYFPRMENKLLNSKESLSTVVGQKFKAIKRWAGIDNKTLTFKQCRHTHAYRTLASSDNIYEVSNRLGHKSVQTTQNNYVGSDEKLSIATARSLSKFSKFGVHK